MRLIKNRKLYLMEQLFMIQMKILSKDKIMIWLFGLEL
jgi:hypothetical protein